MPGDAGQTAGGGCCCRLKRDARAPARDWNWKTTTHQNGETEKFRRALLVRRRLPKAGNPRRRAGYFFFFAALARGFAAALGFAGAFGFIASTGAAGLSPSTPLSGQILKAGHFWQPATIAMGQMVMMVPGGWRKTGEYARPRPHEVVCFA